jgi:hypothetical protein
MGPSVLYLVNLLVPRLAGYISCHCRGTRQQITVVSSRWRFQQMSGRPSHKDPPMAPEIGLELGGIHATIFARSQSRSCTVYPPTNANAPSVSGVSHREPIVRVPAFKLLVGEVPHVPFSP